MAPLSRTAPTRGGPAQAPGALARLSDLESLVLLTLVARPGEDRFTAEALHTHASARALLASSDRGIEPAAAALADPRTRSRIGSAVRAMEREGIEAVSWWDAGYPADLRHLYDPPPVLYFKGKSELLGRAGIAIVGTRRMSSYGAEMCGLLAGGLSRAGFVVLSGLARGVDSVAHRSALERGTLAVLGAGIDVPYPRENAGLHAEIGRNGLLVSEFAPGTPPRKHHFPQRNRILAALGVATVVVEAPHESGALITARFALEMGRELFAVPGPVGRVSDGCNQLLVSTAHMARNVADVLRELPVWVEQGMTGLEEAARAPQTSLPLASSPESLRILAALTPDPEHLDTIAERAGVGTRAALEALFELEVDGHARQLAGKRFARALAG